MTSAPVKVKFEPEDRPPARLDDVRVHRRDPTEWVKAKEFVPTRVNNQSSPVVCQPPPSFIQQQQHLLAMKQPNVMMPPGYNNLMHQLIAHKQQLMMRHSMLMPRMPDPRHMATQRYHLPNGYSASMTNITPPTGGPPIPAIVLKKRRRKKHLRATHAEENKDAKTSSQDRESESTERSQEDVSRTVTEHNDVITPKEENLTNSCPDLSQANWQYLDDIWLHDQTPTPVESDALLQGLDANIIEEKQKLLMVSNSKSGTKTTTHDTFNVMYAPTTYVSDDDSHDYLMSQLRVQDNPLSENGPVDGVIKNEPSSGFLSHWSTTLHRSNSESALHMSRDACCVIM